MAKLKSPFLRARDKWYLKRLLDRFTTLRIYYSMPNVSRVTYREQLIELTSLIEDELTRIKE